MPGLSTGLYGHCRETLLQCDEFGSYRSLRAVFVTEQLTPFQNRLPAGDSPAEQVELLLDYLIGKRLSGGDAALPVFLATLGARYMPGDALRDELESLAKKVATALAVPGPPPAATPLQQASQAEALGTVAGAGSIPAPTPGYDLGTVSDLLRAAFTADDLRRLFLYTSNPDLRPVKDEFSSSDGLTAMVEKTIKYCQTRNLLPALLSVVEQANPRQYARFESQLGSSDPHEAPPHGFPSGERRRWLEQELAQHERNLARLRNQKAVFAAGEEPLSLLNQIDHEEQEIQRVQAKLDGLADF